MLAPPARRQADAATIHPDASAPVVARTPATAHTDSRGLREGTGPHAGHDHDDHRCGVEPDTAKRTHRAAVMRPGPYRPGTITERVACGAAWLDTEEPGWHERINLDNLNLQHPSFCVLGQLGPGGFAQAADERMLGARCAIDYGFLAGDGLYDQHGWPLVPDEEWDRAAAPEYRALTAAWADEIRKRQPE